MHTLSMRKYIYIIYALINIEYFILLYRIRFREIPYFRRWKLLHSFVCKEVKCWYLSRMMILILNLQGNEAINRS